MALTRHQAVTCAAAKALKRPAAASHPGSTTDGSAREEKPSTSSPVCSCGLCVDQNGSKRTARYIEVAKVSGKKRLDDHFVSGAERGACREIAPKGIGRVGLPFRFLGPCLSSWNPPMLVNAATGSGGSQNVKKRARDNPSRSLELARRREKKRMKRRQ